MLINKKNPRKKNIKQLSKLGIIISNINLYFLVYLIYNLTSKDLSINLRLKNLIYFLLYTKTKTQFISKTWVKYL